MGLFAQKLLAQLVMPVGLVWLGLLAGLAWTVRRQSPRWMIASLAVLAGLYSFAGNAWLGHALLGGLESSYPPGSPKTLCATPFDAIFLAGGSTRDVDGHFELSEHGDRLLFALRLYRAGCTPLIVTSGRSVLDGARSTSAEQAEALLVELGVPADAVARLDAPRNSKEEVQAFSALAKAKKLDRVGVVSSAWHLRRIMKLAKTEGLALVPLAADHEGRLPRMFSPVPTGEGFALVGRACWERLGALVGR